MKQFHTKGREHSGTVRASPSPGGEGRGEGERFLQSHFRSRRLSIFRISDRASSRQSRNEAMNGGARLRRALIFCRWERSRLDGVSPHRVQGESILLCKGRLLLANQW